MKEKGKWWSLSKREPKIQFNPGEFTVLDTKAQRAWWENGGMFITNHRLFWFPAASPDNPVVEVDLQKVLGCVEVR